MVKNKEEVSLKKNLEAVSPSSRLDELQLTEGARQGEEGALEQIFRLHKDRVFSICLRMTGNFYEAEDLVQESFMQAFKKLGGFRGESSFSTWLYRVTINVVLDSFRRRHTSWEVSLEGSGGQESATLPKPGRSNDLTLERLRLERAIAELPAGYRIVLVLHDVEGYSHEEISESIGSSVGTCKSQLHKARMKLREFLSRK